MTETTTMVPKVEWYDTLRQRFGRGEADAFLLYGNVFDFVTPSWPLQRWLTRQFVGTPERPVRDVVMTIGVDRIDFATVQQRRLFEKTMGYELPEGDERYAACEPGHPDDVALPHEPSAMLGIALDFLKLARRKDPGDPNSGPKIEGGARSAVLIISRADLIIPPADKNLMTPERLKLLDQIETASTDREIEHAQGLVIMLTPSLAQVHQDVISATGVRAIHVPLPDYEYRLAFIQEIQRLRPSIQLDMSHGVEEFASITAGQTLRDIDDITLRAGNDALTRQLALERGQELMDVRYGSVLQRLEPTFGFDGIGANDTLKGYLRKVIRRIQKGETKGVPMGIALCGPPGTGKSALAMAFAYEAGINAVQILNLKDKWVGNSEKNVELLIEGIEMFGKCIVFIDEFDKAFGSSEADTDHPVDAAMRKRMQEWLGQESHRGRILILAATNYPSRVDPALFRTGRIDVKAPMLAPASTAERVDIFLRLLQRYGQDTTTIGSDELQQIGRNTPGWVGSDIEFAVSQAVGDLADEDNTLSLFEALQEAVEVIVPADNRQIRAQTEEALRTTNLLSLLPPTERERRRQERQQRQHAADVLAAADDVINMPDVRGTREL